MKIKVLLFAISVIVFTSGIAQKVKRKGVQPLKLKKTSVQQTPKYTLAQVAGKWEETTRTNHGGNSPVSFIDTLQISIKNDSAIVRDGVHLTVVGNVYLDPPNSAKLAGDIYTIEKLNNDEFVLDDGVYVHYLKKTNKFYYESFEQMTIKPETFETPIEPDPLKLQSRWTVYRRDALPGTAHDYDLIRFIDFKQTEADGSYSGEVGYFSKEGSVSAPCKILFKNNEMQIITEKNAWVVSVYKADGNEFIFGNKNDVLYFTKKI